MEEYYQSSKTGRWKHVEEGMESCAHLPAIVRWRIFCEMKMVWHAQTLQLEASMYVADKSPSAMPHSISHDSITDKQFSDYEFKVYLRNDSAGLTRSPQQRSMFVPWPAQTSTIASGHFVPTWTGTRPSRRKRNRTNRGGVQNTMGFVHDAAGWRFVPLTSTERNQTRKSEQQNWVSLERFCVAEGSQPFIEDVPMPFGILGAPNRQHTKSIMRF